MEIKREIKNEDGSIGQIVILLESGAEVIIDDSCFEEDGHECVLVDSYPEETTVMGYGDVDVNITIEDRVVTDIEQPNAEDRRRQVLRSTGKWLNQK